MLNLHDTEIAFKGRTNVELNRSFVLFKMMGYPSLVKYGKGIMRWAFRMHLPIKGLIKKTLYKQFCGGENIEECKAVVDEMYDKYKVGTILDYSAEGQANDDSFETSKNEVLATIKLAKGNSKIPFTVFKITGLARFELLVKVQSGEELSADEKEEFTKVRARIELICKTAHENKVRIFLDAEETWIQKVIDSIAEEMIEKYNKEQAIVYNTIQLYRNDRITYLKDQIENAREKGYCLGLKLVRGAYMEKERKRAEVNAYPSTINANKEETDRLFNKAVTICVENLDAVNICAGTHNESSCLHLVHMIKQKGIKVADERVFFAQLYGMSNHISFNLAAAGYNVVKYVPYGPVEKLVPYLIRRAKENTSIAGQTGRELKLIMAEKKRRKA
ncbi:MAG: proline dehydrogenase family protein [Bacteroidetes bacterium]|nr:proline dehydrogenase family protein [Bacteroidota bacterium]